MTTIICCADPLAPGEPDAAFAVEAAAAERAGFTVALLSYERLVHEHNLAGALRRLARQERPTTCLYRGCPRRRLQGGLVFRTYVPFRTTGSHPQSGMPLAVEHRTLIFNGQPLLTRPYWEGTELSETPPLDRFAPVIAAVPSQFFTLDVAQHEDGSWMIVELGDGQVAGLPPETEVDALYTTLAARLLG